MIRKRKNRGKRKQRFGETERGRKILGKGGRRGSRKERRFKGEKQEEVDVAMSRTKY